MLGMLISIVIVSIRTALYDEQLEFSRLLYYGVGYVVFAALEMITVEFSGLRIRLRPLRIPIRKQRSVVFAHGLRRASSRSSGMVRFSDRKRRRRLKD